MEKEKHNLHFDDKNEFLETFLGKFNNRKERVIEEIDSSLFGKLKVDEISLQEITKDAKPDQKIDIAALRKNSKFFADTYELSGLLYNPMLDKVGLVETNWQLKQKVDNTQFQFQPADPKIINHFHRYLENLHLSYEEAEFFKEFPQYFNNPSFGIVEEEPGNIHRMIYADKIPIGVYSLGVKYLGLVFNKHNKKYELRTIKFEAVDYDKMETRYIEAENLTPSMFSCFENLYKYIPSTAGASASIFGTSKTKTIAIRSSDEPDNETLQVVLGVGLKTHLKHQERTHMQYQGLAFNRFLNKVGKLHVSTERRYEGMGTLKLQSKVEYFPNNPNKLQQFTYQLENLLEKADQSFFMKQIIPFFANLAWGDKVTSGEHIVIYPILADSLEIGSYLVNTRKMTHNYRGLMVKDLAAQPFRFLNTIHNFETKPRG